MNYSLNNLGIINALGSDRRSVWETLLGADQRGLQNNSALIDGKTIKVAAIKTPLPDWPDDLPRTYASRNNKLLIAAVEQIRTDIDRLIESYGASRIGIVIGSSTSGILEGEIAENEKRQSGELPAQYDYHQQEIASPSEFLARYLHVQGPALTVSTACTSSAKAFASARRLLDLNLCDAVITGGADSLCRLTVNGFNALASLSHDGCNPFSLNRDGITIGEAAAVFILSREPGPVQLSGIGESCDAHHISAPDPEGKGAETAMRDALVDADVKPDDIDYINLHGTGTALNDKMESHAVARIFGNRVACSSSKAQLGHTLGAAGATEAALCWLSLTDDSHRLPPHVWDGVIDPELAPLAFCSSDNRQTTQSARTMLSNSFAFGGSNTCLLLQRS